MSISSTQGPIQYTITALPQVLTVSFPFQLPTAPTDLLVTDGANVLIQNADWSVTTGGGYNASNQMQTGSITIVNDPGSENVQIGDIITIARNVALTQTTTFASTGILTPLMIESDDDKLTIALQQIFDQFYQPFPILAGTSNVIFLGWITAETGGTTTSVDTLSVTAITTIQLPLLIGISISDDLELWKLRPIQIGDPGASLAGAYIVPITNPNSLIYVRVL